MKKLGRISILIGLTLHHQLWPTNVTSQTFMFPRPLYHNLAAQNGPWLTFITSQREQYCSSFQIIGAYQNSLSKDERTGYFSIDCKKIILVAGDRSVNAQDRDVRAEFLNLPDNFTGLLKINPQQLQRGFWFTYFYELGELFEISFLQDLAFEVKIPVIWVENTLNLQQLDIMNPGADPTKPRDILEALNQPALNFAKMFTGKRHDGGIAEVRFDLRTTFIDEFPFYLATYSGFIVPTFRRVQPDVIFDPLVGINRHPALVFGANILLPLSSDNCPWLFSFFFDVENRFYIRTTQCRTFDLRNLMPCRRKQWSRYLPVREEGNQATTFAANILTLPVRAKPDNMANLDMGFRFYYGNWQAEAGYQLWVHGDERIELRSTLCENQPFIFERFGIAGTGTGSASRSTINTLAENDLGFVTIKENDIDLLSGASRGVSTNMVHVSLSYTSLDQYTMHPLMLSLGAFYEAPKNNAALTNWGIWGKIGTRF